jgi:hypothetical protein
MLLKCKCGREWDYQGRASLYALCPKCKSKVRINPDASSNISLEKLAFTIPIEIGMPQMKNQAFGEAQKYAQEVFGEPSLAYVPIFLTQVIRVHHSNCREILGEIDRIAKEQGATSDEIIAACNLVKERVDCRINKLMLSNWCVT